jgi:hypothetical protein
MKLIALRLGNQHPARIRAEIQRGIKARWIGFPRGTACNLAREAVGPSGPLGGHVALRCLVDFTLGEGTPLKQEIPHPTRLLVACDAKKVEIRHLHFPQAHYLMRERGHHMPDVTIVYWRDIPAQVIVGKGRRGSKAPLPERFEQAIDRAAMKTGMDGTDAYLSEWRKAEPYAMDGEADEIAAAEAARLDAEYGQDRLKTLIENDGWA